jgi:hypothetical protein
MNKTEHNILEKEKSGKFLSSEFKQFFLLEFTKQLILNSAPIEVLKLKEFVDAKDEEENRKNELEELKPTEQKKEEFADSLTKEIDYSEYEKSNLPKMNPEESVQNPIEKSWGAPKIKRKTYPFESFRDVRLTIPEPNLPERLRYLRPTPSRQEIDLGKLNPLVKDPFVRSMECLGPDTNIIVKGKMGEKKTAITLSTEEIDEIVKTFARESKIPVQEGVYKVAVGSFIFLGIISEVVNSRFIIKKMLSPKLSQPPSRF